ncbi:MAG: YgfZ/GcvT domain-containing protein [Azovibrio sp.]
MNPDTLQWHQTLSSTGAVFSPDKTRIIHFGQVEHELDQTGNGTILVPLLQLSCLEVGGSDAKEFLHNQLTNDVNHLKPGQVQHTAWCTAKGRMLSNFLNYAVPDGYRMILQAELLPGIFKRLQMFVLRAQVRIKDCSEILTHLGMAGPEAASVLRDAGFAVPAEPMMTSYQPDGIVIRLSAERFILALDVERAPAIWEKLSPKATVAGNLAWDLLDIKEGLPWITMATKEEFVPQMADFEKLGGVSFHKGCYPGQEIVARTQYLGKVKRHLYRLESSVDLRPGEDLFSPSVPDQAAGKVISCAPGPGGTFVALAVILAPGAADLHQKDSTGSSLRATAVNP